MPFDESLSGPLPVSHGGEDETFTMMADLMLSLVLALLFLIGGHPDVLSHTPRAAGTQPADAAPLRIFLDAHGDAHLDRLAGATQSIQALGTALHARSLPASAPIQVYYPPALPVEHLHRLLRALQDAGWQQIALALASYRAEEDSS